MKKALSFILCVLLCGAFVFAQDAETPAANEVSVEQTAWISVDAAFYPGADYLTSSGWAGLNFAHWGLEGRVTPWYEFKVNTPGKSGLTAGNNVKFQEGLEVTPVSAMIKSRIVYTPIAFLYFTAGADVGTGWDCGPFKGGMAKYNGDTDENGAPVFDALTPFNDIYSEFFVEGVFQFDSGALISDENPNKDWLHIVMMASYKVAYTQLSNAADGEAWKWQLSGDKFNGWNWYSCFTLGYMMPKIPLKLVGVQIELDNYFPGQKPASASFLTVGINPTFLFQFDKHNSLGVQCRIKDRSSYATANRSFLGTPNGTEWFFDRIAFSYTYTF